MTVSRRDLLRASGAAAAAGLAGCPGLPFGGGDVTVQWAVTGATAGRGFHAPEGAIPAEQPSVSWEAPLEGGSGASVYATAERAVAQTPAALHGIPLEDGAVDWRHTFQQSGGGTEGVLTPEGLHVRRFFPNAGRRTDRFGLSVEDGSRRYDASDRYRGSALWAPTAEGLFGLTDAGTVSRYDPGEGEWGEALVSTGGELWGTTADDDRLYLPVNRDGSWAVEAYGLASGELEWSRTIPWDGAVSMVATGETVVMTDVPSVDGAPGATGHDPATGEVRWTFTWEDRSLFPWRGVAAGGTVYLLARPPSGGETYRLAAVDVGSGDVRWRVDTDLQLPFAATADRLVGTTVTTEFPAPGLVAIEADGTEAWRFAPDRGVEPGIAVDRGVLAFVATGDGRALALLS